MIFLPFLKPWLGAVAYTRNAPKTSRDFQAKIAELEKVSWWYQTGIVIFTKAGPPFEGFRCCKCFLRS